MTSKTKNQTFPHRPKIGLALGSGSARGLSHIGVIRALEDAGVKIDFIAGTSIGAIIGAIYASGKLNELEKNFLNFDWKQIAALFDVVFPSSGIIDGKKVSEFLREHINVASMEELSIPLSVVATNIHTGDEVTIQNGDVIDAVRASISVPGIFTPVRNHKGILVDGGLVNPVPVSVVRAMGADIVIAVDVNNQIIAGKNLKPLLKAKKTEEEINNNGLSDKISQLGGQYYTQALGYFEQGIRSLDNPFIKQFQQWRKQESLPNIFEVLLASVNIIETRITETRLSIDKPEILIQPPLGDVRFLEFNRAKEIIATGYKTAYEQLDDLSEYNIQYHKGL